LTIIPSDIGRKRMRIGGLGYNYLIEANLQRGQVKDDGSLCLHGAYGMTATFDRLRTEGVNQHKNDGTATPRDDGFTPARPLPKRAEVSHRIILASQTQVPDYSISGSGAQSGRGVNEVPPKGPSRISKTPRILMDQVRKKSRCNGAV
jgi:hypothetical protein